MRVVKLKLFKWHSVQKWTECRFHIPLGSFTPLIYYYWFIDYFICIDMYWYAFIFINLYWFALMILLSNPPAWLPTPACSYNMYFVNNWYLSTIGICLQLVFVYNWYFVYKLVHCLHLVYCLQLVWLVRLDWLS